MARKIIQLELTQPPADYKVVFWLNVPQPRQFFYANPVATSAVKNATAEELAAIRSGAVVEEVLEIEAGVRPGGPSEAQIAAAVVARFNARQSALNASTTLARYGTYWDGNAWTIVTVA
jgi:hypothetical protein